MPKERLGERWTRRLKEADELREDWRNVALQNRRQYQNVGALNARIKYNVLYAAINHVTAALQIDRVEGRVRGDRPESAAKARVTGAVVNWNARESKLEERGNEMLQDGLLSGVGMLKVSWQTPFAPRVKTPDGVQDVAVPGAPSERNGAADRTADQQAALRRAFPSHLTGRDMAQAEIVDPFDFLLDPSATNIEKADWVGHRAWLTKAKVEDLQKSGYFRRVTLTATNPELLPSTRERWRSRDTMDDEGRLITLHNRIARLDESDDETTPWEVWEIHDRINNRILHIMPGNPEPLRDVPNELAIRRPPYVDFRPDKTPLRFWSLPQSAQYLEVQQTLDSVVDYMVDIISRHSKTIIAVDKGMSPEDQKKIAEAAHAELVALDNPSAAQPLNVGALPSDIPALIQTLRTIITEISGVTQMASGVASSPRATATEVATISQAMSVRMRRMKLDLDRSLKAVLDLYLDLSQQFLPIDTVIRVAGMDAENWKEDTEQDFLQVSSREQIEGEFTITLLVGAAADMEQQLKRQQILQLMNFVVPNAHLDQRAFLEHVLREFDFPPGLFIKQQPEGEQPQTDAMGPALDRGPLSRDAATRDRQPDAGRRQSALRRA